MSLDLIALGSKIKGYRDQFELTLEQVSTQTAIPVKRLIGFEHGTIEPTGDELLIIADLFRCDFRFFISNEKVAPYDQTQALFRVHGEAFTPADRWAVQEFLFLCSCEEFLQAEMASQVRPPFRYSKSSNHLKTQGADAAAALRVHLAYPELKVPTDLYRDFRSLGIHIFRRKLENSSISGLFIRHPSAGRCVLVNYTEDVYRQRFTVAHEVAHAILDDGNDFVLSFAGSSDLSEVRANTFASHFLAPRAQLHRIPDPANWDQEKVIHWARQLRISTAALSWALVDAKLINRRTAADLRKVRVPRSDKEDPEFPASLSPGSLHRYWNLQERGLSRHYAGLVFEATRRNLVSRGRAAEMLLVSDHELSEVEEMFGRMDLK